jgi:hypothetical protein
VNDDPPTACQKPVIGKRTGPDTVEAAPAATTTGAKCSCVGRLSRTPGAFSL